MRFTGVADLQYTCVKAPFHLERVRDGPRRVAGSTRCCGTCEAGEGAAHRRPVEQRVQGGAGSHYEAHPTGPLSHSRLTSWLPVIGS